MNDSTDSVDSPLVARHCRAHVPPVNPSQVQQWIAQIPGWKIQSDELSREFAFENFYKTMAFVNAIAWIVHAEDHHPDLAISYNRCTVNFSTHSVSGLSENDFICAAKIDAVLQLSKIPDSKSPMEG